MKNKLFLVPAILNGLMLIMTVPIVLVVPFLGADSYGWIAAVGLFVVMAGIFVGIPGYALYCSVRYLKADLAPGLSKFFLCLAPVLLYFLVNIVPSLLSGAFS